MQSEQITLVDIIKNMDLLQYLTHYIQIDGLKRLRVVSNEINGIINSFMAEGDGRLDLMNQLHWDQCLSIQEINVAPFIVQDPNTGLATLNGERYPGLYNRNAYINAICNLLNKDIEAAGQKPQQFLTVYKVTNSDTKRIWHDNFYLGLYDYIFVDMLCYEERPTIVPGLMFPNLPPTCWIKDLGSPPKTMDINGSVCSKHGEPSVPLIKILTEKYTEIIDPEYVDDPKEKQRLIEVGHCIHKVRDRLISNDLLCFSEFMYYGRMLRLYFVDIDDLRYETNWGVHHCHIQIL